MNIKTKYNIGDRVWIVYEAIINNQPAGEVSIYDDTICSIEIGKGRNILFIRKSRLYRCKGRWNYFIWWNR